MKFSENYKSNKKWINDEIENYATHSDKIVFVQNLKRMNYLELSDDERINIWDDNLVFFLFYQGILSKTKTNDFYSCNSILLRKDTKFSLKQSLKQ